ncbi:hypothetical protein [Salinactinospora qingdaonensis]|uniref:DUF1449 family protein n=1 Tax=Salinactinospora qingdaonensis TaxID=702744 RepID=A0ABP7F262_9ACTN
MREFLAAVITFPTALFTFSLLVVAGYWVLVLLGAAELDALDVDPGSAVGTEGLAAGGLASALAGAGMGGVPATVALSLLIAVAWFVSLTGNVVIEGLAVSTPLLVALSIAVLLLALVCAWLCTSMLALLWRRLFPDGRSPSQQDFIGRVCVIRTGRVTADFGQAEVTAADGSSSLVQVRQIGTDTFTTGSSALIYEYSAEGGFFWVAPYDAELDPNRPPE